MDNLYKQKPNHQYLMSKNFDLTFFTSWYLISENFFLVDPYIGKNILSVFLGPRF